MIINFTFSFVQETAVSLTKGLLVWAIQLPTEPLDYLAQYFFCLLTFRISFTVYLPLRPGSYPRHSGTHRCLHVASPLVHVARHLRLPPRHRRLPHPVRVAQPVWYDASWTQPRTGVLLLLGAQRVLRHSLREDGGHQATEMLDRPPADEPLGNLLSVLPVHLHCESSCRHGRGEDLRTTVRDTWPKGQGCANNCIFMNLSFQCRGGCSLGMYSVSFICSSAGCSSL